MAVRLEEDCPPYRRLIVRQIAGQIARRIVCWVAPGEGLERGQQLGMIKSGSRTDLILPSGRACESNAGGCCGPGRQFGPGPCTSRRVSPEGE